MNNDPIKCDLCGRFISYDDIDTGMAHVAFAPDNAFGGEEYYRQCRRCYNQNAQKDAATGVSHGVS